VTPPNTPIVFFDFRDAMPMAQEHQLLTDEELARLQLTTLRYYLHETNPANGLIRDKTHSGAPASIAAIGLALATLPILALPKCRSQNSYLKAMPLSEGV